MIADELRLFFERVLGGFQAANDHGVDHAVHLQIGQFSTQRLVFHLGQPTDHVVLWVGLFRLHLGMHVGFEGFEFVELGIHLFLGQDISVALAINKGGNLRIAPFSELRDI